MPLIKTLWTAVKGMRIGLSHDPTMRPTYPEVRLQHRGRGIIDPWLADERGRYLTINNQDEQK